MTALAESYAVPRCQNCEAQLEACEVCGSEACPACSAASGPHDPACAECATRGPSARRQAIRFWESKRLFFTGLIAVVYIVAQYVVPYPCRVGLVDGVQMGAVILLGANVVFTLTLGVDWLFAALVGKRSRLVASVLLGAGILACMASTFGVVGMSHFWDGEGICGSP